MSDRPRPADERDFVEDILILRELAEGKLAFSQGQVLAWERQGDRLQERYWSGYRNAYEAVVSALASAFQRRARAALERARMDRLSASDIEEETHA